MTATIITKTTTTTTTTRNKNVQPNNLLPSKGVPKYRRTRSGPRNLDDMRSRY